MKTLHLIPFILVIVLLFSCSAPRQTYYFSWRTVETNSKERADFSYLAIDTTQSSPLLVSTRHTPVNFFRHEISIETPLNEIADKTEIHKNVKANLGETVIKLLKQKSDTTRSELSKKVRDPKKNKFAELGFLAGIIGIISFVVGVASLSTGPLLFGGISFILGFIGCLIGLKSEKKKLAKAGVILFGIIAAAFLAGFLAFAIDFGLI